MIHSMIKVSALFLILTVTAYPAGSQESSFDRQNTTARQLLEGLAAFQLSNERKLRGQTLRRDRKPTVIDGSSGFYSHPFTQFEKNLGSSLGTNASPGSPNQPSASGLTAGAAGVSGQPQNQISRLGVSFDLDFRALVCMQETSGNSQKVGVHPTISPPMPTSTTRYQVLSFFNTELATVSTSELFDLGRSGQAEVTKKQPYHTLVKVDWQSGTYLDADTGEHYPLPACFKRTAANFFEPTVGYLSSNRRVDQFADLRFVPRFVEEAAISCPPLEKPGLTIGQQTRRYQTFTLDARADDMFDYDGFSVRKTLGEVNSEKSKYFSGCRAPRLTKNGALYEKCSRIKNGKEIGGTRVWRVHMNEKVPPRGYYLDGEKEEYTIVAGTWTILMETCGGQKSSTAPAFTVEKKDDFDTDILACSQKYGASFPDGNYTQKRSKTTRTVKYTKSRDAVSDEIITYGEWGLVSDECSISTVTRETERKNEGCTALKRDFNKTTKTYADGRTPTSVDADHTAWVVFRSTCRQTVGQTNNNTTNLGSTNKIQLLAVNTLELWPECPMEKMREAFINAFSSDNIVDLSVIEVEVIKGCTRTRNLLTQLVTAETTLINVFKAFRSEVLNLEALERDADSDNNSSKIRAKELEELVVALRAQLTEKEKSQENPPVVPDPPVADDVTEEINPKCSNPRPMELIEWSIIGRGIDQPDWMVWLQAKDNPKINTKALVGEDFLNVRIISVDFETATVTGMDCIGAGEISEINFNFDEANRDVVWFNDVAPPALEPGTTNPGVAND